MEVHHHPHVENKGFKEYLLEGLMIFIAVTMGFFAENLREHFTDKKNEKQIISALNKDLIKDTIRLHYIINTYVPAYHSWVDSSHTYVDSLPLKGNERKICRALFNATYWESYTPPSIALTILKNPATFSLIENEKVKKEILNYNVSIDGYIKYGAFLTTLQHYIDTSFASIVSRTTCRELLSKLVKRDNFLDNMDMPDLIIFKTYNIIVFQNYLNRIDYMDFKIHDINSYFNDLLHHDIELLKLFDENYHIKNE